MNTEHILHQMYHPLGMHPADLAKVLEAYRPMEIPKGTQLAWLGEPSKRYILVQSGLASSYVWDLEGRDIPTNFFPPGTFAMDNGAFFLQQGAQENIVAITPMKGWEVKDKAFQEIFTQIQGFRYWGRNWMVMT